MPASAAVANFDLESTVRALAELRKGNCETYEAVERQFSNLLREHCHVILVPWWDVQYATWWLKAYRDPDDWFRKINDQAWLDYQGRRTERDLRRALGEDVPCDGHVAINIDCDVEYRPEEIKEDDEFES
jgi:hypothetical protein